ncbi:MAG: helix-turn-helix domain-containing protein [Anaerolineales bacterium]|nr:helix-turn-helix domain-containing protein [Anaerolineales bacterium]
MVTDETLTVQEVADYLKVSRTTVWRWCHQGLLPAFKIGRGWRVRRGDLEKIMEQKREEVFGNNLMLTLTQEKEINTAER